MINKIDKTQSKPKPAKGIHSVSQIMENDNAANYEALLRFKKKQIIESENHLITQIKKTFSDLTLEAMESENRILQTLSNGLLLEIYEKIDYYCGMPKAEQEFHHKQMQALTHLNIEIDAKNPNQYLQDFLKIQTNTQSDLQKTNKKLLVREGQGKRIQTLEKQLQNSKIKEQKLLRKLKNGKKQETSEGGSSQNYKIERLEAENKVLVEQIYSCSEKIMQLTSQISVLYGNNQNVTNLSCGIQETEKKEMDKNGLVLIDQYKELVDEIGLTKQKLLEKEKELLEKNQQITLLIGQVRHKENEIEEAKEYNNRLYNDYEVNVKKKVQLQQRLNASNKEHDEKTEEKNQVISKLQEQYKKALAIIKLKQQRQLQILKNTQTLEGKIKCLQTKQIDLNFKNLAAIHEMQSQVKHKNMQISEYQTKIKQYVKEIEQNKQEIQSKKQEIEGTRNLLNELSTELAKVKKQKQSAIKKQVTKTKKELKKQFQKEKSQMVEAHTIKLNSLLERIAVSKEEFLSLKVQYEKKAKIGQNRYEMLKQKIEHQMKQIVSKMKVKGNLDVIEKYIESQSTIALKDSQIRRLKEQGGRHKKMDYSLSQKSVQEQLCLLQINVISEKCKLEKELMQDEYSLEKEGLEQELRRRRQEISELKMDIQRWHKENKQENREDRSNQEELIKLKNKLKKLEDKNASTQNSYNSSKQTINKLHNENQQLKQELKLKKQFVNGLKKENKEKEEHKAKLNDAYNALNEELQRVKRVQKQANRKEAMFNEIKDKVRNVQQLQTTIGQLRKSLQDKVKYHKSQIVKKDNMLKEYKINEEILNKKIKSMQCLEQEVSNAKNKNKKIDLQVNRKDKLIQHLKEKTKTIGIEKEQAVQSYQQEKERYEKTIKQEQRKYENMKLEMLKNESAVSLLKMIIIKVYEKVGQKMGECSKLMYKTNTCNNRTECSPGYNTKSKYDEGLSILHLTYEDMDFKEQHFSSPQHKSPLKFQQGIIEQKLNSVEIQPKQIIQQFIKLLQI